LSDHLIFQLHLYLPEMALSTLPAFSTLPGKSPEKQNCRLPRISTTSGLAAEAFL
jgi:hypothetical protein